MQSSGSRPSISPKGPQCDWPALVCSIVEAGEQNPHALPEVGLASAQRATQASRGAIIGWVQGQRRLIQHSGNVANLFKERRDEGSGFVGRVPIISLPLDADSDLVVAREPGSPGFDQTSVEALRAVASLLRRVSGQPQAAVSALYEVATKMLASFDLDEVFILVTNAASRLLGAEISGILLLDSDNEQLVMRHVVGHRTVGTARLKIRRGQGLAGKALETGVPHRVDDYTTDMSITKEFLSIATEEGTQSALCAPMRVFGRTIGVLCVWRRQPSVFSQEAELDLSSLAHLATMAVHNADLYEAERTATQQLREAHVEVEERYQAAERALRIHQELTRIAVDGDDLGTLARAVQSLTAGTVVLMGDDLSNLLTPGFPEDEELIGWLKVWLSTHRTRSGRPSYVVEGPDIDVWRIVAPISAAGNQFGHLCVALSSPPDQAAIAATEQAAVVCALLLAREEAAISATRRLQSEFVWDLLEGRIPDATEAVIRARHLGRGFTLPARILLLRITGLDRLARTQGWSDEELERARSQVAQTLTRRIELASVANAIVARRADLFAVILPRPQRDMPQAARDLGLAAASIQPFDGLQQAAGLSALVETVASIPDGFRQAQFALSATAPPREPVCVFDDLGVLQFLLAPAGREDLERFSHHVLGSLIAYDRQHNGQLVRSLQAYLAANCTLKGSAEAVFVHHKTMRYRLRRIEDLTGLQLDRQEDRFQIQLALKILSLPAQDHQEDSSAVNGL